MLATGPSLWDTIIGGAVQGAENQATSWLLTQYTALRAMPQRLTALQNTQRALMAKIPPGVVDATGDTAALIAAGVTLGNLVVQFPTMIAAVDQAYNSVRTNTGGVVADAAQIAAAVFGAQQFNQSVSDVTDTEKTVIDHLLQSGAISQAEATALVAQTSAAGTGWLTYLAVGLVAWIVLKKIL